MTSYFMEFRNKEIINVTNGVKIGYVDDIIFDVQNAEVVSIVVYGRNRLFGILGRDEDMTIKWSDIEIIGEDTILIKDEGEYQKRKPPKVGFFTKLFA